MWFGVAPRMDTKKAMMCSKEIFGQRTSNMITILSFIDNIIQGDMYLMTQIYSTMTMKNINELQNLGRW